MPYRTSPFVDNFFYHIYNRGVEKRRIFNNPSDYQRFLKMIYYYQFSGPKPSFSTYMRRKVKDFSKNPKIVEIVAYCLMPNHFHLLIKQLRENGVSEFIGKLSNGYTKYYNIKYGRIGPLLQGVFKAKIMETNEHMLHISRYIHLNPYVAGLVESLNTYPYSSYQEYIGGNNGICFLEPILEFFKEPNEYKDFVEGHGDYARELEMLKHLLLDGHE